MPAYGYYDTSTTTQRDLREFEFHNLNKRLLIPLDYGHALNLTSKRYQKTTFCIKKYLRLSD